MDIKLVKQRITILETQLVAILGSNAEKRTDLGNRSSEYDNFVQLTNPFHELVNPGTLDHINIMVLTLNLNGNGEIGTFKNLE